MRIHITGNAGAGKTSLAKRLGHLLGYPVFHLDQIVWRPYWEKTSEAERALAVAEITSGTDWIVEGVSEAVRSEADLVIFLDVPRYRCLWRCARRNLPYLFRSRPELPEHCPEFRIVSRLVRIIWKFPILAGCDIRAEAERSHKYMTVRNDDESAQLIDALDARRVACQRPSLLSA